LPGRCSNLFQNLDRWLWVPARAEPVIGPAKAGPVGLAGTTEREISALHVAHPTCDSPRLIELLFPGAE